MPVAAGEAAGAGEEGRALGESPAVRLGVLGGANRVLAQRLVGEVVVHGNPAAPLGVLLDRGVDRPDEGRVILEPRGGHRAGVLKVGVEAGNARSVRGHRQESQVLGQLHLPIGRGEVEDRFALG